MLTIKKVQVVPLDENYGKIIDSFDTQDDKTSNAPSINAVENYVDEQIEEVNTNKQNKALSGTAVPTNDLGEDGDIYLRYSS